MEDKQQILDLLLPALQATDNLSDLISLKYNQDEGLVEARFIGGCKYANVNLDSGTSMIKDVIHQIV